MLMLAAPCKMVNKNREIGGLFDSQLRATELRCSHLSAGLQLRRFLPEAAAGFARTGPTMMHRLIAVLIFLIPTNPATSAETANIVKKPTTGRTNPGWT